jgi:hypothetical protein
MPTDLLTLVDLDGGWRIVSKVFHYDLDVRRIHGDGPAVGSWR